MTQFQLGSISTGTLRTEDLLPAFMSTLDSMGQDVADFRTTIETMFGSDCWDSESGYWDNECAQWDMDELFEKLGELCPPFVYFGTLEGDGADFGFWPDRDALDEALTQHDVPNPDRDGCQVLEDDGVIVQVSDHGNVTVMDLERNVIWSVV